MNRQSRMVNGNQLIAAWQHLAAAAIDVVAPRWCVGCGAEPGTWCAICAAWANSQQGVRAWLAPQVKCAAAVPYRGPVRRAVSVVKDRYRYDGIWVLGELLARAVTAVTASPAVLIPVPSRAAATRRRGRFVVGDVAAYAAAVLGPHWSVAPVLGFCGPVTDQSTLTRAQRSANVTSRVVVSGQVRGNLANYVVVDDVVTSGASVNECVRALTTSANTSGRPYTANVSVASVSWVC